MSDELFEIEVDMDSTQEELNRAKALAEINLLRLRTDEVASKNAVEASQQYANRVIHFNDVVDYKSCRTAITQLAEFARQSSDPIEIIFHSPGGDIFSGWGLFDYMQLLRAEGIHITTVILGGAFSMAGLLLQGGDHRVATPHSWLMIHEAGMTGMSGTTAALKDEVDLLHKLEAQGNELLSARSGVPVAEIQRRTNRRNWWLSAEEALAMGFIDEIRPVAPPTPIRRKRRSSKAAVAAAA